MISTLNVNSIPTLAQRRLIPTSGFRYVYDTSSNSNYNALYFRFDKRLSHGLQLGANYTWSKLMSDNDEALGVTNLADSSPAPPQDYRNIQPEWAVSAFDRTHRFVVSYSYRMPWFTSGMANRAVPRQIFSGWELAGFSEFQSGQPFTVRTGVDSLGNGRPDSARPDYNPNGILLLDPVDGNMRTFTAPLVGGKFVTPLTAAGAPLLTTTPFGGNLGRNTFRAPGFATTNLSLSKTFFDQRALENPHPERCVQSFEPSEFRAASEYDERPQFRAERPRSGGRFDAQHARQRKGYFLTAPVAD